MDEDEINDACKLLSMIFNKSAQKIPIAAAVVLISAAV